MNNDDQNIIWGSDLQDDKKSSSGIPNSKKEAGEQILGGNKKKNPLYDDILSDLARRSAEHKNISFDLKEENSSGEKISTLRNEISNIISGDNISKTDEIKSESVEGSASTQAAISMIDRIKNLAKSNIDEEKNILSIRSDKTSSPTKESGEDVENKINSIKESIRNDLGFDQAEIKNEEDEGNVLDEQTRKLLEKKEKGRGIEQTYYSDLSEAMGSNRPETMSELLEKARFEKKESRIKSFKSKKNIAYVVGALILLIGITIIIGKFFFNKKEVKYITEERVKSLVYSDMDTGINVTNIDSEQTKQAIRKVIETEIEEGKLHQIYYAGKDQFGNLRRLGVKQIFEKTENIPPTLLYQNIENEFMHGIYKSDGNKPFIILKALSYDRAFEGMREWEDTMIDDLSTYLDLPKEVGDRSLMEDGFSYDIIKNKNVRVARFLPREVDRRKGIWDIVSPTNNKKGDDNTINNIEEATVETDDSLINNTVSYLGNILNKFRGKFVIPVYAQVKASGVCYDLEKICFDFYGKEVECMDSAAVEESLTQTIIKNQSGDTVYTYTEERDLSEDYSCIKSIDGSGTVGDKLDTTKPIICYKIGIQCVDEYSNPVSEDYSGNKTCTDIIYNEKFDTVYGPEKYGDDSFACINSVDGYGVSDNLDLNNEDIVCYLSHKECVDSFGNQAFYSPDDTTIICNDIIYNGPGDSVFPASYYGKPGYSCFSGSSSTPLEYNDELVNTRGSWDWLLDIIFDDSTIENIGPIQPGQTLDVVEIIQSELVLLGLLDDISITGTFDLLTQEIISHFQQVNGLLQTGIIDENTLDLLKGIISGRGEIFGGSQAAIINDYISVDGNIGLGTYSEDVQTIQILLFVGGYNISRIDGVFDKEVCSAIQDYQKKNGLEVSSDEDCIIGADTLASLNGIISNKDYLGSGFILNGNSYLVGSGVLQGVTGPGTIGFEVNDAEADSLNEGDVVLMYTFLDEKTILIARDEEVITEIIKRRAFNDIFNKS